MSLLHSGRFAVLDIESTGVNIARDRIVQVAVVQVDEGKVKLRASWYIYPERPVGEAANIHGITDERLASAATFSEVARDILSVIGDRVVVGYNAARFDAPILATHFARAGIEWQPKGVLDAWHIVQFDAGSMRLSAAAAHYGVEIKQSHDALDDVRVCWNVLNRAVKNILKSYDEAGIPLEVNKSMPTAVQQKLLDEVTEALNKRQFARVRSLISAVGDREPKLAARALAAIETRQLREGFFTVVHSDDSEHEYTTVRIRKQRPDDQFAPGQFVLSYLSGSDNDRDYTQFAVEMPDGPIVLFKKFRGNDRLRKAIDVLSADPKKAGLGYALKSGCCSRCGRKLTVPASLHAGMGPDCAEKA